VQKLLLETNFCAATANAGKSTRFVVAIDGPAASVSSSSSSNNSFYLLN
jgi:hypothetical protein